MGDGRRPIAAPARAAAVWAAVAALALVLTGCRGSQPDAAAVEQVRAALQARGQLLVRGDVDGYLAGATGTARGLETRIARGAAAVRLSQVNVTFRPRRPPAVDATAFERVRVGVVFKYQDLPQDNTFRFDLLYDVARRDGAWVVTRSVPDTGENPLPLWVDGEVGILRSPHFLFLFRPGLEGAERARDLAEEARDRLAIRLDRATPDDVHLVLLARDHREMEAITGQRFDEEAVAAATAGIVDFSLPEHRHMVVNLDPLFSADAVVEGHAGEVTPLSVFQHELAHLALSRFDDQATPAWVAEGAAMYLAGERRVDTWREALARDLFDGATVAALVDPDDMNGLSYGYANAAVLVLIRDYGAEAFWDFVTGFRPLVPSREFYDDPARYQLGKVFGLDAYELDRRTVDFMRESVGLAPG